MKKEEKKSLIEYMVKYCGYTYYNAAIRFAKGSSDRLKGTVAKRSIAENKKMTKEQMETIIIYMHKQGFTNDWIAKSLGTLNCHVSKAIKDYEELIQKKK